MGRVRSRYRFFAAVVLLCAALPTARAEQQHKLAFRPRRLYDPSLHLPREALTRISVSGRDQQGRAINKTFAHLTEGEYLELSGKAQELLTRYPPDKHVFVGVGRAPAPFVAYLQNIDPNLARNLPAGGIRNTKAADLWSVRGRAYGQAFEQHIGEDLLGGDRAIVLIDRSVKGSGSSLVALKGVLQTYLKQKHWQTEVKAVGLSEGTLMAGVDLLNIARTSLVYLNYEQFEEPVGAHRHFRIGVDAPSALRENPGFAQYKGALEQRMKTDAALDLLLSNLEPLTPEQIAAQQAAEQQAAKALAAQQAAAAKAAAAQAAAAQKAAAQKAAAQQALARKAAAEKAAQEAAAKEAAARAQPRVQIADRKGKATGFLSVDEYSALRDASATMLGQLGGGTGVHFVAVGRTAAPVFAFVAAANPAASTYLPADGISKGTQDRDAWFAHFDRTFSSAKLEGKTVALMRRAESGESLGFVRSAFESWAQARNIHLSTKTVGFVPGPAGSAPGLDAAVGVEAPALAKLLDTSYKAMAPAYFQLGKTPDSALEPRREFGTYVNELTNLVAQDSQAQALLQALR